MGAVRFFISSRFPVLPLALAASAVAGISCQTKTGVVAPAKEKPAERELKWEENELGGVAAMPAAPVPVHQGSLPLVYLSEQAQNVQVIDEKSKDVLAEFSVEPRSIIRIDARNGVAVGKEGFYPGPLPTDRKYGIYVIPQSENVSRTGTYQPRPKSNVPEVGE